MSIPSDIITEKSWKIVLAKTKVKDNGLQRALANYDRVPEEDPDACLKTIAAVNQCATNLKKSKDAASVPAVLDHITDLLEAIQSELKDLAKAKAEKQKTDAAAAKKEEQESKSDSEQAEQEAEDGAHADKLLACFKKLKSSRDAKYHFIACDAKPYLGLVITKQPIGAKHRNEVTEVSGGSKKYFKPGTVWVDNGKLVFDMDKPPAGFAAKMKKAFKYYTSLNIGVIVGDQTDEDEEGEAETAETEKAKEKPTDVKGPEEGVSGAPGKAPEPGVQDAGGAKAAEEAAAKAATSKTLKIGASVGRGGKNKPEDVMAVQAALNERAKAGLDPDGKLGGKTIQAIKDFQKGLGMPYPDGLVEPGNLTEKALNGEKITIPERPKAAKSAPGGGAPKGGAAAAAGGTAEGAAKGAAGGAKGGGFFGGLDIVEMMKQWAKEAADRKKRAEKLYQEATQKLEEAAKLGGNKSVDPKYKEALQKAYEANQEHDNLIAELIKQAMKAQDEAKAKAVQETIKAGQNVLQTLETAATTILRII